MRGRGEMRGSREQRRGMVVAVAMMSVEKEAGRSSQWEMERSYDFFKILL